MRRLPFRWSLVLCLVVVAAASAAPAPRSVPFRTRTMGTWGVVHIVTADSAAVADAALASLLVFHRVDSLMSNWTDRSEVARINREAGHGPVRIHPEVASVIAAALEVARASDGAQDITVEPLVRLWGFLGGTPRVPSADEINAVLPRVGFGKVRFDPAASTVVFTRDDVRIDLGGIAKGYAVDEAAAVLRRARIQGALVDLTGNMMAIGNSPDHDGWVVGVRDPSGKAPHIVRVRLRDGEGISTSGNYEQFLEANGRRYGHIIDPRSGWPASGVSSVTVVGRSAMLCDAWDTGLFVLGSEAARRIAKARDDFAVILVEPGANGHFLIWIEESLRSAILVDDRSGDEIRFF